MLQCRECPLCANRRHCVCGLQRRKRQPTRAVYFNCVKIDVNLTFNFVPRPFTTAKMASATPEATRPYSLAVAPDSSAMNGEILQSWRAVSGQGMKVF